MKRFIVISILAAMVGDALACAIPGTHNYYLFSTVNPTNWKWSISQRCDDNWKAYSDSTVQWFNANKLREVANKKNDALMVSYIDQLEKYIEICERLSDRWDYPTKEEQAKCRQQLSTIRQYALSKIRTRLRSQHGLLYMRCNMMLGRHQDNVTFWQQTASKFINSVYRDMMLNIYAGALLKSGRTDEATQIFMEQGDVESLYTYYYKKRSFESIKSEYLRQPNSPALPFLLQDFANNSQEAIDAQEEMGNLPGKLFIRDIGKAEAMKMCALATQVIQEKKTEHPALWLSVKAWLLFLFDDKQQALATINEAVSQNDSGRCADNARALRLFITASQQNVGTTLDDFLASELTWLEEKAKEERNGGEDYENHYTHVYDRLVHQVLVPRYDQMGRSNQATAFLCVYDEQPVAFHMLLSNNTTRMDDDEWNGDYSTDFFYRIDHAPVNQLEDYLAYTMQQPQTALDRWLSTHIRHDEEFLHEVIGTKYLRLGQWAEAEKHLALVSLDFINHMNIASYMAQNSYQKEPWMKGKYAKEIQPSTLPTKTKTNQKLDFVREMQQMEQGFGMMEPDRRFQRAYDLAIRYAQASFTGKCWYLTRYGVSVYDSLRSDEINMLEKARELLKTALSANEFLQKEKTLFALAYLPDQPWYTTEWNDEKADYEKVLHRNGAQYQALLELARFEKNNATRTSEYVSHCDVLKEFIKSEQP